MSGTTATAAQQTAFQTAYGPLAVQAGQALNVDPNLIYGQWATESGYGTSSQSAAYNVAGIMPGGTAATYSSPQQFEAAYVSTIQQNDPGAIGAGSSASTFVSGLQSGNYFGSDNATTYQSNITSIAATNPTEAYQTTQPWSFFPTPAEQQTLQTEGSAPDVSDPAGLTAATQGANTVLQGLIDPVWEIVSRGLIIILGIGLVLLALAAMLFQSGTTAVPRSSLEAL